MIIRGWRIDGFGIFRDYETDGQAAGLNVFLGPNEAGKSTLLAFLRGMLFGFPEGGAAKRHYPPLRGGTHGGTLRIEHEGERLSIERRVGRRSLRVTIADGRRGDGGDLERALAGIDAGAFQSVFAFGLSELEAFDSLSTRGVRERLYSAMLAGAARSARRAIDRLSREAAEVLSPRGEPRGVHLLRELERVRAKVSRTGDELGRHAALRAEEERAGERLRLLEANSAELRRRAELLERILELWPLWQETARLRAEVTELDGAGDLPLDSQASLAAATEKARAAAEELEGHRTELAEVERRRAQLASALDDRIDGARAEIDRLHGSIPSHREALRELDAASAAERRAEETLARALSAAGSTAANVSGIDPDRAAKEIARWREALERARQDLARALDAFSRMAACVKEKTVAKERLAAVLTAAEPPSKDELDARDAAVRRARAALGDLRVERAELSSAEKLVIPSERAIEALRAAPQRRTPAVLFPAALAAAAAAALGAAAQGISGNTLGAAGCIGLAVVSAVTALLLRRRRRRLEDAQAESDRELERRGAELDDLRARVSGHRRRARELARRIADESALLGCSDIAASGKLSFAALEDCAAELRRLRDARERWDERSARLESAGSALGRAREEEDRAAAEVERLRAALDDAVRRWESWKAQTGFGETGDPSSAEGALEKVRVARAALSTHDGAGDAREAAAGRVRAWEHEAQAIIAASGVAPADGGHQAGEALIARLVDASERSLADAGVRRDIATLEAEAARSATRVRASEERLQAAHAHRDRVLAESGASDEDGLRRRVGLLEKRRSLRERLEAYEAQLSARIERAVPGPGAGAAPDEFRRTLATGAAGAWRGELDAIAARLDDMSRERDDLIRRQTETAGLRRDIEESAELATLRLDEESLLAELASRTDGWKSAMAAAGLIAETLAAFERERRPRVLAGAGEVLARVTRARHVEVRQADDLDDLVVVASDGSERTTAELSRGTAEQLYLALRLALVREHARTGAVLPVVMDDVLVNFDPERAELMAGAVADLAREQQVFVFTCQPRTTELLLEASPEAAVYPLGERLDDVSRRLEALESSRPRAARAG